MKRMVENSEKIEELADDFKNIYIFKDTDYSISSDFPGTVRVINLGTALLVKATINSGTPTNTYYILTIYKDFTGFNNFKMSNGNEFYDVGPEADEGEFTMTTNFNETLAEHTSSKYDLIFLIGHDGVQS